MAYSDRPTIGAVVGDDNVTKWADLDLDGDASTIAATITLAITWADTLIDDTFRDGPYEVPFVSVPTLVKWWSAKLAAVRLYRGQALQDDAATWAGKMTQIYDDVKRDMRLFASGTQRFAIALGHSGPTSPAGGS